MMERPRSLPFRDWWNRRSRDPETVYALAAGRMAWRVPWELLFEHRDTPDQMRTCIVRVSSEAPSAQPSAFNEPLRVLVLTGGDRDLDLKLESKAIVDQYRSLPLAGRSRVDEPVFVKATVADIPGALRRVKPHVLWFSGHGLTRKTTSIQMADGEWVDAETFAQLVGQLQTPPLYCVFLSCSTAAASADGSMPILPSLVSALQRRGVLAVLAMQDTISDTGAITIAATLFRSLAEGLALERAVTLARSELYTSRREGVDPLDWATPVVWSNGKVRSELLWASGPSDVAQLQLFAINTLRGPRSDAAEIPLTVTEQHQELAERFLGSPRLWLKGSSAELAHRLLWRGGLRALQSRADQAAWAVDCAPGSRSAGIGLWAAELLTRLLPGQAPRQAVEILSELKSEPERAWARLCGLPSVTLAVAAPPEQDADWFWEPLLRRSGHVAILSDRQPPGALGNWILDAMASYTLDPPGPELPRNSRLVRVLTLLRIPLAQSFLTLPAARGKPREAFDASTLGQFVIATEAGPVLGASRREEQLQRLTQEEVRDAHEDCLAVLDGDLLSKTAEVREERVHHLIALGLDDAAATEMYELMEIHHGSARPGEVLRAFALQPRLARWLPSRARLIAASACLATGEVGAARGWLASEPTNAADRAWRHALLAEFKKDTGDSDGCLQEIDQAIRVAESSPTGGADREVLRNDRLAYTHDRARILQHVLKQQEQAEMHYRKLLVELVDAPGLKLLCATAWRNLAECLRTQAAGEGSQSARWQAAEDAVKRAEEIARQYPHSTVWGEVLYEQSRLAAARGAHEAAVTALRAARGAATASAHGMLAAIIDARQFWQDIVPIRPLTVLEGTEWRGLAARLSCFPRHGWAVRSYIDWQLQFARSLESGGQPQAAAEELVALERLLSQHQTFVGGSDRRRRGLVHAGLLVLRAEPPEREQLWARYLDDNPAVREWVSSLRGSSAEAVWHGLD
jgi:hypothetical protein